MTKTRLEIKKEDNKVKIFVYQENELVEFYFEDINKKRLEGNIYLGVVKDVLKGMQSAFIDIGEEKNALIHIKDVLSKQSNITGHMNIDTEKYQMEKLLKQGDMILVQIKRDCDDQKGSRVTKDIKLTGKYIVLMPYTNFISVSKKIEDINEKNRLAEIVRKNIPNDYGAIIRTSACGIDEEKIKQDINELEKIWKNTLKIKTEIEKQKIKGKNKPIKLYDNNRINRQINNRLYT